MKKKNKNFVSDGYTEKAYVKESELNGEFRFTFRPMLTDKRVQLWKDCEKLTPELGEQKMAMGMVHHVINWDITDEHEKPVDITARNLLRLKPVLWSKLCMIISGLAASDVDPDSEQEEQHQAAAEAIATSLDKTAAELRQEADAKN